ncbi:MAG: hypothetical protein ACMV1K_05110 [Sulfurospirillum sp.]
MGWYDAYKGNVERVNTTMDKSSNAGVNIGEAFSTFGKALNEEQRYQDAQKANDLNNELKTVQLENAKEDSAKSKKDRAQAEVDNTYLAEAYKNTDKKTFDANRDESLVPSATAVNLANTHFDKELERLKTADDKAQGKANSSLMRAYAGGGYKDFQALKEANPELVEYADGATVASIKKAYDDNSKAIMELKYAQSNLSHQQELNKKEAELANAKSKENKANGGYDGETTNGKIVTLLKSSLGLDNQLTGFTDEQKKAFDTNVAEISTIAKNYNLSSNLAFTAWQNIKKAKAEEEEKNNNDPLGLKK